MERLFLLLFIITCVSCSEKPLSDEVLFFEPQPNHVPNAKNFSKRYQGHYTDQNNNELLIQSNQIIKIKYLRLKFSREDIDSTINKNNDTEIVKILHQENMNEIRIDGDSIFSTFTIKDTIFIASNNQFLRFFKGSYFLNYKNDENSWRVKRLDLNKKNLSISALSPSDSLFSKLEIKEKYTIEIDSGVFDNQIKPTKQELKKLLKEKSFTIFETWTKD